MFSVVSSYLGRVVASNSKRGYLCSIVGSCLYLIWGSDSDEGMPFGYSQISISGPAHDGDGSEQGLEDDLE
jgi:hypothetical protein